MIPAPTHADTIVVLVPDRVESGRRGMGAWADFYASRGYPSVAIDVLVPKAATVSPVYPRPERDTKAAIQYVRAHADRFGVDPSRIVVQGFGAGAALGAEALVSADDAYFDGSGRYEGVSDRVDGFIGFSGVFDGSTPNSEQYYGGPSGSADPAVQDRYERAHSIAHASGATGPALLFQPARNDAASDTQGTRFDAALKAASKDSTLLLASQRRDFDRDPATGRLSPAGKRAAQQALEWLARRYPPQT